MTDLNKVAVRLHVGISPYQAGETCSLSRSVAEGLERRGYLTILKEKVEATPRQGHSFVRKLNRIVREQTRKRKERFSAQRAEEQEDKE